MVRLAAPTHDNPNSTSESRSTRDRRRRRGASNVCTLQCRPQSASRHFSVKPSDVFSDPGTTQKVQVPRPVKGREMSVSRPGLGAEQTAAYVLPLYRRTLPPSAHASTVLSKLTQRVSTQVPQHRPSHSPAERSGSAQDSRAIIRSRAGRSGVLAALKASPSGPAGTRLIASHRRAPPDSTRTSDRTARNGSTRAQGFHPFSLVFPSQMLAASLALYEVHVCKTCSLALEEDLRPSIC